MEPRKLTKEDIDKVRGIEGFPIGTDEDIIALSDAPFYTACPNPFIKDFIQENGTLYDEATDNYQREPFAADVSEGKTDPIYYAHSYHTKVPYKAIMRYILHYTDPGDVVLDGFCGTGMTGVAAQMCGIADAGTLVQMCKDDSSANAGVRYAIVSDLSPAASFIAHNYNHFCSKSEYISFAERLLADCKTKYSWMYKTNHTSSDSLFSLLDNEGEILYTVWSDVFVCPHCGEEIIFYNVAVDDKTRQVKDSFCCLKCGAVLKKKDCKHAAEVVYDRSINGTVSMAKQVPVLINYTFGGKRYNKIPDEDDLALIERINNMDVPEWYPTDIIQDGEKTAEPIKRGITRIHQFYTRRNLIIYAYLIDKAKANPTIQFAVSASQMHINKMRRYQPVKPGGTPGLPGTLFLSSISVELSLLDGLPRKINDVAKAIYENQHSTIVATQSASDLSNVPSKSIDYIFTDPPFGSNLNYSELNILWEAWLKCHTSTKEEAIMSKTQGKGLYEYQSLMEQCFTEYYRVLKPNRWITVEFHNSQNSVWVAIQEALNKAGFIVADVHILDKQQYNFNQVKGASQAIKQDLVISAYKPKDSFNIEFQLKVGTEETAWSFVRQHLSNLPVVVTKNGQIEVLSERQAFLLWDRMVAYHIMHGISVPLDATDFYKGLEERFLKRDNMYFLPDQVNEYDLARSTCEVEPIQFSLFVSDEKSAISWLYQQLSTDGGDGPQTYQDLMPKFMQECKAVDKREKMPELSVILEENFLKDEDGKWYIPDLTKNGDIAKLREKNLLKEFQEYLSTKGKLKVFRSEAIRAGFAKLWKDKDYATIVSVAERLPEETIQEDPNLLMYYDISLSRV